MTLRKKTLLIIAATFLSLIAILYFASQTLLLNSFNELEEQNTRQNVERALSALSNDLSSLDATAGDWAGWDDTYAFIEDANTDYIESNLIDGTFTELKLNLMLFINPSGRTVFGKAFDLHNEEEIPVPQSLLEHLSDNNFLVAHPDTESSITGIVLLPEEPMLITSQPILTSEDEGPIRGTLIMGRYLDAAEIERLADITHLPLIMHRFTDPQIPPDFQEARLSLSEETPILAQPLDEQSIAGYTVLKDVYGKPSLVLRVDMPRDIYQQGQETLVYRLWLIIIVGAVCGVVAMWILEKQVLSRLANLSKSVSGIGITGDLSKRVSLAGRDEISNLASGINNMLAALQKSEDELNEKAEQLQVAAMEAQAVNQAKSQFLSGVSHELRTPLTAIIGLSQLLQKKYYGDLNEKQTEYVQDILESSNHLLSLINDILDLTRIEAGKSEFELVETEVKELMESSLLLVKESAVENKVSVQLEVPEKILRQKITVDRRRFRQIMVNLLSNAVKFTPAGGKVIIEAERRQDELVVSITDTGIGVSPEEQERIFDAFYQASAGTTGKSPGTGLGLSLTKHLVEQHHGQIWVESEGVGKGSRFSFTIPLEL